MKKLTSVNYSSTSFNIAMLLLRVTIGIIMAKHGYDKITHFNEYSEKFISFMGLSPTISLGLTVFAEFFCSILLAIGLFTRLAAIPLIITMAVALFVAHSGEVFGKGELPTTFLLIYIVILLLGPGKISLDAQIK